MNHKPKTIGELLLKLEFTEEDLKNLIIDIAYEDLTEVRSVYSWVGLIPEESNMIKALEKPHEKQKSRIEGLIDRAKSYISGNPNTTKLDYDWTKLITHLPVGVRTPESYLSHNVPQSLRDITNKKLEPLVHQLNDDRQFLLSEDYHPLRNKTGQFFNEYIAIPSIALLYFLTFGKVPEVVETDSRGQNVDKTFLKVQKELKMMFTDAVLLTYFEDFEDKKSINYRVKVDCRLKLFLAF